MGSTTAEKKGVSHEVMCQKVQLMPKHAASYALKEKSSMQFSVSGKVAVPTTNHGKSSLEEHYSRESNNDTAKNRGNQTTELRGKSQSTVRRIKIRKDCGGKAVMTEKERGRGK